MPRDAADTVIHDQVGSPDGGVAYYCAACGAFMTRPSLGIRIAGGHDHTFVNPVGIRFDVRCFADAPGAVAVGSATPQHTWFSGFDWRIALCATCGAHVGWMYEGLGPPAVFFGLIRPMLVERKG
jgi:hypothetical protein